MNISPNLGFNFAQHDMTQTSTIKVLGDFCDRLPHTEEYLTINFSPSTAPRKQRWGNNGLSADFLGDYFAAFFPGDKLPDSKIGKQETVKGSVSFIANELLENAMKYSQDSSKLPVNIALCLYDRQLIFTVTNHTDCREAEKYQTFVHEITTSDLDELYTQKLELAATGAEGSGMGLLIMLNDYDAKLGWKFETLAELPNVMRVTVMVQLEV